MCVTETNKLQQAIHSSWQSKGKSIFLLAIQDNNYFKLQIESWKENNTMKTYWQRISQTIFRNIVLVGNMSNMNVKGNSLWCWVRIVETKFVHPTSWGFKLKLIPRCSLWSVHRITTRRCHLIKIQPLGIFSSSKSLFERIGAANADKKHAITKIKDVEKTKFLEEEGKIDNPSWSIYRKRVACLQMLGDPSQPTSSKKQISKLPSKDIKSRTICSLNSNLANTLCNTQVPTNTKREKTEVIVPKLQSRE